MSISRRIAELALHTPEESLPDSSREAARKMLLDTCACAFCGRDAPGIPELVSLELELSAPGNGDVFFTGEKLALPSAAYCNAAMIHALDFDNNYSGADLHILSIVVPVALACGQDTGASGREVVSAMILGVEAAARIAKPYMRAKRPHAYFLTTSLVGGWGGVAAAARLLGLSVDQTVDAMGIYYAHTCGNRQALLERALTKRIQPAIAAKASVYSALLARRGVTGPEETFEGNGGFYRCYTQSEPPPEEAFTETTIHGMEELGVKQFPTCGVHHANIVSALHLKREHGFTADGIERVDFFLNEGGGTLVSMPFSPGRFPQIDAQFCAPYAIALALVKGKVSVRDFHPARILEDRKTAELAGRTRERDYFADLHLRKYPQPEPDFKYTKVTLRDGRVFEHGCGSDPLNQPEAMDPEQVRQKFHECVLMYEDVDRECIDRVADVILDIEDAPSIGDWMSATLRSPPMTVAEERGHDG
ncbi:MAG: MmgE/PrpD family protein [Kiritimatiellae bacterium]|jgi:2-methylcitrate dehydratase PrpD|nr:MmgE/PrpD family protein [Kiritimatiellia bacterium]